MTNPTGEGGGTGQPSTGSPPAYFTQEQVNHFAADAKRSAIGGFFKDLGVDTVPGAEDLKGMFTKAAEYDKLQQGSKSDVERLTGELATKSKLADEVPTLKVQMQRAEIAGDAGLKPRYWKYVEGTTEDEIKASVKAVLEDVGGKSGEDPPPATGGRPPEPTPQQGTGGGGQPKAKTLSMGAEAYKAKHNIKE